MVLDASNKFPVQTFETRLRVSPLFEKGVKTGISLFQRSMTVKNLDTFAIQVKLQKPIEIPR